MDKLYILVYRHLSGPLLRKALNNLSLPQGNSDQGPIIRKGETI